MKKGIFTKVIAVAMTLVMMMSLFAPIVSAANWTHDDHTHDNDEINYVSLGDSMTNGYGLDGYNGNTGVEDYGTGSYANLFANWLEEQGNTVNHAQLAMSAMRAEDLHWLLEVDYTNQEQLDAADMETWDADKWAAAFPTTGDYWTWNEISHDYRMATAATYILAKQGNVKAQDYLNADASHEWSESNETEIGAKYYQDAVANADIISLSLGNGNFGVFMLGRIMEAVGFDGSPEEALVYDVERALSELDPTLRTQVLTLIDDLYGVVGDYLNIELKNNGDGDVSMMESLANTVVYTAISFVLNYIGSIDAILTLNPDAEIVLIGLMNTFDGSGDNSLSLGGLLDKVYAPLNLFIAGLPAVMQVIGNSTYADAKFYYADAVGVESFSKDFRTAKNNPAMRDRFVADIVGTEGDPSMIWGLLSSISFIKDMGLYYVTAEDINEYESKINSEKIDFIIKESGKAISCALYLAFEEAIITACETSTVSIDSFLSIGDLLSGDLFNDIIKSIMGNSDIDDADKKSELYINMVNNSVSLILDVLDQVGFSNLMTGDELTELIKDGTQEGINDAVKTSLTSNADIQSILDSTGHTIDECINCSDDEHAELCSTVKTLFETLTSNIALAQTSINSMYSMINMVLSVPTNLSAALVDNDAIASILALYARCLLANGIGNHPSAVGHVTIYESVKTSYNDGHTVQDEITDAIYPIVNKYYEIINQYYEQAYADLLANGSIDTLKDYIVSAQSAVISANDKLPEIEVNEDLEALKALLSTELLALNATLDELLDLIDTADTIDAETWAALMGLEDDLNTHINNVQAIIDELGVVADIYIGKAIDAVKYYSAIIDETATEVFEKVMLGVDTFKKAYLEFVEITSEQAGKISPALADAVHELLVDAPQDALSIIYAYGEDAVIKLCIAAADASGELYDALVTLATLVEEYGWDIYYAIKNSSEFDSAVNGVKALEEELKALYTEVKDAPISTVLNYKQKIESLKTELEVAYTGLYELAMSAVDTAKPVVADMLDDAIDNVKESVLGLVDIGEEYSEWITLRTGELISALLISVADHAESIGSSIATASPDIKSFVIDVLSDLGEYVDNVLAEVEVMIRAQIHELSVALDEFKNELKSILDEEIDKLKKDQPEFMSYTFATLADGGDASTDDDRTIGDALEDLGDLITSEIKEKIAQLERKIAELEQKIADLEAAIEEGLVKSAAKIEAFIDDIVIGVNELVDYVKTEGPIFVDNTVANLISAAESLKTSGIEIVKALYDQAKAELDAILARTLYFDYTVSRDSNYVAIGNFAESENYANILADKFGGIQNTLFDNSGYRLADLRALLDESFVNDDYGNTYFNKAKLRKNANIVDDLKAADIITVDLGMADFTTFATNQIIAKMVSELDEIKDVFEQFKPGYFDSYTMYEMDWSYFGEFGEDIDVEAAVDQIFAEYVDENLPETFDIRNVVDLGITISVSCEVSVKAILRYAIEVYLYALANYAYNYIATVEAIQSINPDAQLIMLGTHNMFDGFVFEVEDLSIDLTYVGEALMRATSAIHFASAVAYPGITYVDIEDAGSDLSEITIKDLLTVDSSTMLLAFNAELLGIQGDKNEYVAEQIFNAANITCEHIYGDCTDTLCNFCGAKRKAGTHVYDDCEDIACNICGALREALKHVYDEDCTDADCNLCGKLRDAEAAHKYDDCLDTDCNNKGCKATRTAPGHTFGDWTVTKEATLTEKGEKERTCTECGYKETAEIEKLVAPTPDDDKDDDNVGEDKTPVDDGTDDGDDEKKFPVWLVILMMLLVLALICVDVWFVFIKNRKQPEEPVEEEPVEEAPVEEEPVEEIEEEEELDITVEELDLIVLSEDEDVEDGVEVIDVVWTENSARKIYKYDPNGMIVERGDVIRVPSRDAAKNREVIRRVMVARGNHRVAPETLKHPLKKIESVVSRNADTSTEDANN